MKKHPASDRWALLAAVRWCLAWIVVAVHFNHFFGVEAWFFNVGYDLGTLAAVLGFFLISGYSIAASIDSRPDAYLQRRLNRIAPVFYMCFVLALLPFFVAGGYFKLKSGFEFAVPSPREMMLNGIMLGTICCRRIDTYGVIWTLSIEWWLYMLAPFLRRSKGWVAALLGVASALVYIVGPRLGYDVLSENVGLYNLLAVSWAWLWGWVLYYHQDRSWFRMVFLVAPACLLFYRNSGEGPLAPYTITAVCLLLVYCERIPVASRLRHLFNYLGALSYPLYLCHVPLGVLAALLYENRFHAYLPIPIYLATLAVTITAVHWLEVCFEALHREKPAAIPAAPLEDLGLPRPGGASGAKP